MAAQPPHAYGILAEQAQEDALHATRLLQVEERPFQRVTRSLLGKDSLLKWGPKQLPSPPPEGEDAAAEEDVDGDASSKRQRFYEDILLDFAALESSVMRIQLIQDSNRRERDRYAAEKAKIVSTAQAVRDNTIALRAQLAEAQQILRLRKGYDDLARKLIPDDNKLKPREQCKEEIEKFEKEIEDLQQESADYEGTWISRREAFDRVVAEGAAMIRVMKGIKDDPEPETDKEDERMEGEDVGEEMSPKDQRSNIGTPAAGGTTTPLPEDLEGQTPLRQSLEEGGENVSRPVNRFLEVENATAQSSRAGSPSTQLEAQADVRMGEGGQM